MIGLNDALFAFYGHVMLFVSIGFIAFKCNTGNFRKTSALADMRTKPEIVMPRKRRNLPHVEIAVAFTSEQNRRGTVHNGIIKIERKAGKAEISVALGFRARYPFRAAPTGSHKTGFEECRFAEHRLAVLVFNFDLPIVTRRGFKRGSGIGDVERFIGRDKRAVPNGFAALQLIGGSGNRYAVSGLFLTARIGSFKLPREDRRFAVDTDGVCQMVGLQPDDFDRGGLCRVGGKGMQPEGRHSRKHKRRRQQNR